MYAFITVMDDKNRCVCDRKLIYPVRTFDNDTYVDNIFKFRVSEKKPEQIDRMTYFDEWANTYKIKSNEIRNEVQQLGKLEDIIEKLDKLTKNVKTGDISCEDFVEEFLKITSKESKPENTSYNTEV